jgi:ribosomal protein L40E
MDAGNATTIVCPKCGAELRPADEACEQCGRTTARPAANESRARLKRMLDRPWVIVVLMLHVGFLGIPAYWKTSYSLGVRLMMVIVSIVYTVGAVAFIVIMLRWLFRIVTGV